MIFGTRDPHMPEAGRTTIKHGLEQSGVDFTWSLYDAEHAFGRDIGARYDPEATDQALVETGRCSGARSRQRSVTVRDPNP